MEDFEEAATTKDTEKLWQLICSIVSDNECDSSPEERSFRVLSKFNQEKMLQNEAISTFYNRFKLRYEARKSLKVPGFQDESSSVRHFY